MQPSDAFFSGSRYAVFGARARGRSHGPVLIAALAKAGKTAAAIEADNTPVKKADTCRTLAEAGPVDGAVLLPPTPWNDDAAAFTADAARQCKEQGLSRVWIYTAGDPAASATIAQDAGLDPVAGPCPCMYITGCGFPHNLHQWLARRFGGL